MLFQKPYRLGVGAVLRHKDGRVFAAQRLDNPEPAWQMPQGGIDEGEAPSTTIFRELLEEIGTDKAKIKAVTSMWLDYDLPEDLQATIWKGRYRGQRQKWFLLDYLGRDADINIATEHPEFRAWSWFHYEELLDCIVPFKRSLYEQIGIELHLLPHNAASTKV